MNDLQTGKIPEGYVRFKTNDRVNRICLWINQVSLNNTRYKPQRKLSNKINSRIFYSQPTLNLNL